MHLYLSSFRLGNRAEELRRLASGRRIGLIRNAMDHVPASARAESDARSRREIVDLGLEVEELDLRAYFDVSADLGADLARLGGVWVRGGNAFVLRRAMRLSGFDRVLRSLCTGDFVYGGYSAGVCVLAPSLAGIQHVDDPTADPYGMGETIWEGLSLLDYLILPHYKSDHPESEAIDREVSYCIENGVPFRTLRDGDVIVLRDYLPRGSA